jgi:hypothetical protein
MGIEGVLKAPTASVNEMDGHCCASPPPPNNALPRKRARMIATPLQRKLSPLQRRLLPAPSRTMSHWVLGTRKARLVIKVLVSADAKIYMMVSMTNGDLMEG